MNVDCYSLSRLELILMVFKQRGNEFDLELQGSVFADSNL